MGFWRGLIERLSYSMAGVLLMAVAIVLASQITSDPDKIMIFSFILLEFLSISAISLLYVFKS